MSIGVDLGGTKVAAGLVVGGKVVKRTQRLIEQQKGRAHILAQIRGAIDDLGAPKAKIGFAVPGYYKGTKISILPNTAPLSGVDLKKALQRNITLGNDAKCFTLAEALRGAGRGKRIVVGLTIGTGLGSGLVIDKKLYEGSLDPPSHKGKGGIPELGHLIYNYAIDEFKEGQHRADMEHFLSGPAILARHKQRGGTEVLASTIWASSSSAAAHTRKESARLLAILCANICRMYGPDVIVIGGGVATARLIADANALMPRYGCSKIVRLARLKDAGILGAAMLVR